jgi:hypothetical protein
LSRRKRHRGLDRPHGYSRLKFDTNEKRLLYARAGIRDYWVDINGRRLLVYRDPRAGDYATQQALGPADGAFVDGLVRREGGEGERGLERRRVLVALACPHLPFPGPLQ